MLSTYVTRVMSAAVSDVFLLVVQDSVPCVTTTAENAGAEMHFQSLGRVGWTGRNKGLSHM